MLRRDSNSRPKVLRLPTQSPSKARRPSFVFYVVNSRKYILFKIKKEIVLQQYNSSNCGTTTTVDASGDERQRGRPVRQRRRPFRQRGRPGTGCSEENSGKTKLNKEYYESTVQVIDDVKGDLKIKTVKQYLYFLFVRRYDMGPLMSHLTKKHRHESVDYHRRNRGSFETERVGINDVAFILQAQDNFSAKLFTRKRKISTRLRPQ